MTNQHLLSVIVPCYNVEQYVDRCISSIVGQTYSNLEIILIDDGSNDSTGMICNAWKSIDQRIKVLHKQNEGVSVARNTGIKESTADYITFVDSDDWIDLHMYSDMMAAMIATNSDIAQCEYCEVFEDGRLEHHGTERNAASMEIIGREDGVLLIVDDLKWKSYMCNKIFKKQLFDHVVFPKGQVFEDMSVMHILFHHAFQSVYFPAEYYFYFRRIDSTTMPSSKSEEIKNYYDKDKVILDRYHFINQHPEYHKILPLIQKRALHHGLSLLKKILIFPQYFPNDDFTGIVEQLRSIPFPQREKYRFKYIKLRLLMMDKRLFVFLRSFYVQVIRVTNRLKITDRKLQLQ